MQATVGAFSERNSCSIWNEREPDKTASPPICDARRRGLIRPSKNVERLRRISPDLRCDVEMMACSPATMQRVFRHFTRSP